MAKDLTIINGILRVEKEQQFKQLSATPSNPPAGEFKVYYRAGVLYSLNSSGTETSVGGSSFPLLAPNGSRTAPSYSFSGIPGAGLLYKTGNTLNVTSITGEDTLEMGTNTAAGYFQVAGSAYGGIGQLLTFVTASGSGSDVIFRNMSGLFSTVTLSAPGGAAGVKVAGMYLYRAATPYLGFGFSTGSETAGAVQNDHFKMNSSGSFEMGKATGADFLWSTDGSGDLGTASNRPANIRWTTQTLAPAGTAAAPSYSFGDDGSNDGMYRSAADTISFATGGVQRAFINNSALYSVRFWSESNSASSPSFSNNNDTNTGMWFSLADTIDWSTGGTTRLTLNPVGHLFVDNVGTGNNSAVRIKSTNASSGCSLSLESTSGVGVSTITGYSGHFYLTSEATYGGARTAIFLLAGDGTFHVQKNAGNIQFEGIGGNSPILWNDGTERTDNTIGLASNKRPGYIYSAFGIGVGLTAAQNASAMLQLDSTSKGVLLPRMTTAQKTAISSPATGLVVFDTDTNALNVYYSAAWNAVGGGSSFPLLATPTGTATAPAYSFSGDSNTGMYSTAADNLSFAVGGSQKLLLDNFGSIYMSPTGPYAGSGAAVYFDLTSISTMANPMLINVATGSGGSGVVWTLANANAANTSFIGARYSLGGTVTSAYVRGAMMGLSLTNPTDTLFSLFQSSGGNTGYWAEVNSNHITGQSVGAAFGGTNGKYNAGGIFQGYAPKDVAGNQVYGSRSLAFRLSGAMTNPSQVVGVYGFIANSDTTAFEQRDPGISAAAIFDNGDTTADILNLRDNNVVRMGVDDDKKLTFYDTSSDYFQLGFAPGADYVSLNGKGSKNHFWFQSLDQNSSHLHVVNAATANNFTISANADSSATFTTNGIGANPINIIASQIKSSAGTAAAPTYSFSGGAGFSDKGLYSPSTGNLGLSVQGVQMANLNTDGYSFYANGSTAYGLNIIPNATSYIRMQMLGTANNFWVQSLSQSSAHFHLVTAGSSNIFTMSENSDGSTTFATQSGTNPIVPGSNNGQDFGGDIVRWKNFYQGGFTDFQYLTTPATPSATHVRLYFKSDDKLYKKTSAGVESEVGGAAGLTWTKYTKTYTDFSTAGTTNSITLFSLPAKTMIHQVVVKHSASFTGGAIASYTVSIGDAGNASRWAAAFNTFQAAGDTVRSITQSDDLESFASATNITATATSTGANLDAATAGSVDVWVLTSLLP